MRIFRFKPEFRFFLDQNLRYFIYFQPVLGRFCTISRTFSGFFIIIRFWHESSFSCLYKWCRIILHPLLPGISGTDFMLSVMVDFSSDEESTAVASDVMYYLWTWALEFHSCLLYPGAVCNPPPGILNVYNSPIISFYDTYVNLCSVLSLSCSKAGLSWLEWFPMFPFAVILQCSILYTRFSRQ